MQRLSLDAEVIRSLFPAYLLIDTDGRIISFGAYYRRLPQFAGTRLNLFEIFTCETHEDIDAFRRLPPAGEPIRLHCRSSDTMLQGIAVPVAQGFLLAVNLIPTAAGIARGQFQLNDFGLADPLASGMPALIMQQASLDDARKSAQDLALEQERTTMVLSRVSRMAGYIAHDFNNFLSIIGLNCDLLLKDSTLGPQHLPKLQIIQDTVRRASATTYSLMTLAKLRHDSRARIDVDELIKTNLSFLRTVAGHDNVLAVDLAAEGSRVEVAAGALLNGLINLVINARDSFAAAGRITISTWPDTPAGEQLLSITVSDNGSGMSAETARQAFEPLFSTKATGNGMGLASVREFCREMGGDAALQTAPGIGTVVTLWLPIVDAVPKKWDLALPNAAPDASPDSDGPAKPTALVVEDERHAREALGELLADLGFRVLSAANADEAIAHLERGSVDLLLADGVMPGMSGIELAYWAEARGLAAKIVLMSGHLPDAQAMADNLQFLRKPLNAQRIRDLVVGASGD